MEVTLEELASVAGTSQEKMSALFEAVVGDVKTGFCQEVAKKNKYFAVLAAKDDTVQMMLLHAVEQFFRKLDAAGNHASKQISLVIKFLYGEDILEEENIFRWYEAGLVGAHKDSAVWKNMKPLIEWIQSADYESEEE